MSKISKSQSGLAHLGLILLIIVVFGVIGLVGWRVFGSKSNSSDQAANSHTSSQPSQSSGAVKWDIDSSGNWSAMSGTPPACPNQPMLKMPADVSRVTSVLYPGQTRGGNYKPHGGLRFDSVRDNSVTVTAPIDGYVYRGARYLVSGETQYTFDIINPCGVMFRLGHLLILDSKYQKLADAFPAAQEGDSRTTKVDSTVTVKAGETIATKVGVTNGGVNTFFDFGVYDLRSANAASKKPGYLNDQHDLELAGHAVCWLKDWLPSADEVKLNALPAGDPGSGKSSDYCI